MKAQHIGMGVYRYGHGMVFNAGSDKKAEIFLRKYLNELTLVLMRKAIGAINNKHN